MSTRLRTTVITGIFALLGASYLGAKSNNGKVPLSLISHSVEFIRGPSKIVPSPDGSVVIKLIAPKSEDSFPTILVSSRKRTVTLGKLQRSAFAFWRPDGRAFVLWDLAYSNDYVVRLVRVRPTIVEVHDFNDLIKKAFMRDFHPHQIVHYWPYVEGWTPQNDLFVIVCADEVRSDAAVAAPLTLLERGYIINTDSLRITSSVPASNFSKVTSNPCE